MTTETSRKVMAAILAHREVGAALLRTSTSRSTARLVEGLGVAEGELYQPKAADTPPRRRPWRPAASRYPRRRPPRTDPVRDRPMPRLDQVSIALAHPQLPFPSDVEPRPWASPQSCRAASAGHILHR